MAKRIECTEAKHWSRKEKWIRLSPFLKQHGREALSYATLQEGMDYFITDQGYIAYTTVAHPVFARGTKRIVLSDPICDPSNLRRLLGQFIEDHPHVAFAVISEKAASTLRDMGFRANCLGYEPELEIQTYNTQGNWKDLDLIKRARNEVKRHHLTIREETIEKINPFALQAISENWIKGKKVNDREIWVYARKPVFEREEGVRKFIAYDQAKNVIGFAFYDPMYENGRVFGYSANILRCDEARFNRLATALHMSAMDHFREEGCRVLNLCLAPFVKLDKGLYNDDLSTRLFFKASERFGNDIYNFKGLSFHKSKYRGREKSLYFASNSLWPSNDVYLAFLSSDITQSYFSTMSRLLKGIISARRHRTC